jgi:bacteriocin biosynthesis cyclodehydratase domain-containing protein
LLKPWYRLSLGGRGMVLRYGASVLEFEGAAATRLLPRLLPLLDGTRRVDDVVAYLGEPIRPAVERAVALLHEQRLLTEAAPARLPAGPRRAAQLLAATDVLDRGVGGVSARLASASVSLLGEAPIARAVARLLRESGVGEVRRSAWDDPSTAELVVVAPSGAELPRVREWNVRALSEGMPWLQLLPFDGLLAAVGPLIVPGDTACHECYLLRRAANLSSLRFGPERVEQGVHPSGPALDAVVAGLAATLALRWLALSDTLVPGVVLAVEQTPEPAFSRHILYRVPRCPACSGGRGRASLAPWHGSTASGSTKEGPADAAA